MAAGDYPLIEAILDGEVTIIWGLDTLADLKASEYYNPTIIRNLKPLTSGNTLANRFAREFLLVQMQVRLDHLRDMHRKTERTMQPELLGALLYLRTEILDGAWWRRACRLYEQCDPAGLLRLVHFRMFPEDLPERPKPILEDLDDDTLTVFKRGEATVLERLRAAKKERLLDRYALDLDKLPALQPGGYLRSMEVAGLTRRYLLILMTIEAGDMARKPVTEDEAEIVASLMRYAARHDTSTAWLEWLKQGFLERPPGDFVQHLFRLRFMESLSR